MWIKEKYTLWIMILYSNPVCLNHQWHSDIEWLKYIQFVKYHYLTFICSYGVCRQSGFRAITSDVRPDCNSLLDNNLCYVHTINSIELIHALVSTNSKKNYSAFQKTMCTICRLLVKSIPWITSSLQHNHNKTKHNRIMCIFDGVICIYSLCYNCVALSWW